MRHRLPLRVRGPRVSPSVLVTVLMFLALPVLPALAGPGWAKEPLAPHRADLLPLAQVARWTSPSIDEARLLVEDAANARKDGVPYRIGYPMAVDLSASKGTWEDLAEGGSVWRLVVESDGARWIVLGFDVFRLQDGASLWVYDTDGKTVMGPYTAADIRDHGQLWVPPVAGDRMVVELDWPQTLSGVEPNLHLGTVSHGYKPFGTIGRTEEEASFGSGACNIDVMCPLGAAWQDEKRGVVILLSGGSGFCTASLINTTANDCRPYVLTANHCGAGASTVFGFNYENLGCGSGAPPPPSTQTVSGATVLANFSSSDFTLLQMSSPPPQSFNAYFNGWSHATTAPSQTFVIHHPSGDVKKISHDADPATDGIDFGSNHWRIGNYEEGTTEPGSSGSPLFDQNSRIVGQLHGGDASCTVHTWDEYGKVAVSWAGGGANNNRLSNWLDPGNTGALTMNGVDWSTCAFNPVGQVALGRATYACSDTLAITMSDDDLDGTPTANVTVTSTTESSPETVTLTEGPAGSGNFAGTFPVGSGPAVNGDGKISVASGDTITVTYIDADDGGGGHNIPRTATAQVDCTGPVITNVHAVNVTGNSATILWDTNEASSSSVTYGAAPGPPGTTPPPNPTLVTSHSYVVTGLSACSSYVYSVASTDGAGNSSSNNNGGTYYSFTTGVNVQPTYNYSGPPVNIPDNTTVNASISVADNKPIVDLNVNIGSLTHSYDGDLVISIVPPSGPPIVLANRPGGTTNSGDNFTNTVFDDQAATSITSGVSPYTGSFRPLNPLTPVNGLNAAGTWTLRVQDAASQDTGVLTSWSLTFTYPAQQCGPSIGINSVARTESCLSGGSGSGNNVVDPGEDLVVPITARANGSSAVSGVSGKLTTSTPGVTVTRDTATYADMAADATSQSNAPHYAVSIDDGVPCAATLNFQVQFTANEGTWSDVFTLTTGAPQSTLTTYTSTDVPKAITDNSTVNSVNNVVNAGVVSDVDVGLSITHSFVGDLIVSLVPPAGPTVVMFNRHGSGGDNFVNTVLDDAAATAISSGSAPYTGTFRPTNPLSAINGNVANGTWTLRVQDAAGGDTGSLTAWFVRITTATGPQCTTCSPAAPGEAGQGSLLWTPPSSNKTVIQWGAASNASYYKVYQGTGASLPDLLDGDPDSCLKGATTSLTMGGLSASPPAGSTWWYLVTGANGSSEGPAGSATSGPEILNSTGGCP